MRRLLITSLLVLAPLVAAQPADAWMPEPVQLSQSVRLGVHAAGGPIVTRAIRTRRRFDMVGVEWRGGGGSVRISLRARSHSGRWTRWTEAIAGGDGPDAREGAGGRSGSPVGGRGASARRIGQPIWAGGSDRVQLRLSRRVSGLRLRLINTTGTATARARARTAARTKRTGKQPGTLPLPVTRAGAPPIVPRSAWGASRCKPRVTAGLGSVRVAFVHHTVSLNGYSRSQAASVVLGVCLFHRNGNGWNDMGYNFLVDRYGRVFEGRAGGIDQPVVGAQAGGFNTPSTGVSMIGDFTRSPPPAVAMRSLARLLAWKLSIHGVPARGRVGVVSAGGPSTGYRAGTEVTLNRISGHRDADLTACPGAALYRQLPALRRRVAALEGPVSALSLAPAAASVPYGSSPFVSGILSLPDGEAPGGQPIEVRARSGGSERVVATATTGDDGRWSATLPPLTRSAVLRAVFIGDGAERPGVISAVAPLAVAAAIDLSAQAADGEAVAVSGSVRPRKGRVTLIAYSVQANGRLRRASSKRVSTRSDSSFTTTLTLPGPGAYRLVATTAADSRTAAGRSNEVEIRTAGR